MPEVEHVGRYELLMELAKGGMAELYLGRLHGVGGFTRLVAIKRILPHLAEDKVFHDMFLNEGRIAAHLSHPNICQVHELGEDDGSLFLAMEYLDGVPWDALIKQMPRNLETLRLVAGVIAQACDGLQYAHDVKDLDGTPTPVIHRDVSPQNLFVTVDGVCKVLDFGVSKMLKDGPRTRTGVLKGKLPYMSPEQIQAEPLDARSDVFALGVCVWEALTGASLFDRDSDFLIWKAITEAPIPALAPHGMPAAIDAVIASALERERDRRFRSAKALGEALRAAAEAVGGAMSPAEIAAVVKAMCGEQIAQRARDVAAVVSGRRSAQEIEEPSPADTIEDAPAGSTMNLRPGSVKVTRRPAPEASRSRWPWIVGTMGVIGAAIAIVFALRDPSSATSTPTPPPTIATPPKEVTPLTPTLTPTPTETVAIVGQARTLAVCGPGKTCNATCVAGDCKLRCEAGSFCTADCSGGRCVNSCDAGATCAFHCTGGHCTTECPEGAKCTKTCAGGTCTNRPVAAKVRAVKKTEDAPVISGEPGTFSIDSSPYAVIFVDGRRIGETPLFGVSVPAGKHNVRAVLENGTSKTFGIVINPGTLTNKGKLAW